MSKIAKYLTQFSIIFTVTIFLWASAEGIARYMVRQIKWAPSPYMLAYTDENIRKIYNTDNPKFYREVMAEGWGKALLADYEPFVEFLLKPYRGKHVNISELGFRYSGDSSRTLAVSGKKIFVFGGSTTFGAGVSNKETIPAYLEAEFRNAGKQDIFVYNFGTVGHFSTQERVFFERLINQGHVPNAVVFIDGLNDFVFCQIPDSTSMSIRIRRILSGQSGVTLAQTYERRSSIIKLIRYYKKGTSVAKDAPNADCTGEEDQTKRIVQRLDSNRRMAAGVANAFGTIPVFVHQPIAAYAYDNALRPVPMRENLSTPWKQNRRGYEIFRGMRERGEAFNENVLWLEEATITENMYIDEVHYSPHFNRHIARQIYQFLRSRLDG
jgi:hypothetical protein